MESEQIVESAVYYGSENVFADLGLPDPEERLAKAKLASAIQDVIEERGLTQAQAAELMAIDQPKVSKILRGRLREFSTERLLKYLLHLGLNIDIVIHKEVPTTQREGTISVAYM
jgi:predicted XRE-type DNA-binding protein